MYVRPYGRMYMRRFHCLYDNSKILELLQFLWVLSGLLASMSLHLGSVAMRNVNRIKYLLTDTDNGHLACIIHIPTKSAERFQ